MKESTHEANMAGLRYCSDIFPRHLLFIDSIKRTRPAPRAVALTVLHASNDVLVAV